MVDPHDRDEATASPEDPQAGPGGGSAGTSPGGGSKANSFQHGLRAKIVFSDEMAQAILERTRMLEDQFMPVGGYEHSLIHDMAVARVKLDIAADLLVANADRVVSRARDFWDFDRRERALKLLRRLPKNPAYLAHKLGGTKQGALLMIERWEGLVQAALAAGDWDEAQRQVALDLLGTALEMRSSTAALLPAGDGAALAAVAGGQIARLRGAIDQVLDRQDAQDRADTIAGFRLADDDESRLLRRYESLAQRDYNRANAELVQAQELTDLEHNNDDGELFGTKPQSMADWLRHGPVKPHLQRVAEGMKARREAREAAAAGAAEAGAGAGTAAAESTASTSSPAPASAAAPSAPSAPAAEVEEATAAAKAASATPAPAPPAAPAAPDQPRPAADEPIKIGEGKSTPARNLMRQLRKAAQECASRRHRKGA
jgi:hypothetical protein